jgi:hypothetical protein
MDDHITKNKAVSSCVRSPDCLTSLRRRKGTHGRPVPKKKVKARTSDGKSLMLMNSN